MRQPDGTYKLTEMTGSMVYMAPEVAKGEPYNETCDCYSFAILLWEMLALHNAFECYTPSMLRERVYDNEIARRPRIDPDWDPSIRQLLETTWSPTWQKRYSMKEITKELRNECVRIRGGDESGLEHMRRRSTFVFEEDEVPSLEEQ